MKSTYDLIGAFWDGRPADVVAQTTAYDPLMPEAGTPHCLFDVDWLYLVGRFGERPFREIGDQEIASNRHREIQTWVSELAQRRSATITIRAHGVLKGVLDLAVRDGSMRRNPADGCQLPRKQRKDHTYLTLTQVLSLVNASGNYRSLILTLGLCGLRWR